MGLINCIEDCSQPIIHPVSNPFIFPYLNQHLLSSLSLEYLVIFSFSSSSQLEANLCSHFHSKNQDYLYSCTVMLFVLNDDLNFGLILRADIAKWPLLLGYVSAVCVLISQTQIGEIDFLLFYFS